jgi:hypothetical protein
MYTMPSNPLQALDRTRDIVMSWSDDFDEADFQDPLTKVLTIMNDPDVGPSVQLNAAAVALPFFFEPTSARCNSISAICSPPPTSSGNSGASPWPPPR